MRVLAIETASEACSIALFEGDATLARDHRMLGRGHAEALVPMIAALPDKGRADLILVSLGPGSFTGVRIGLATARALGFAWGAQVKGYPTLALIAAMAQDAAPGSCVTTCMNGGHGEWFVQDFDTSGTAQGEAVSLTPEAARRRAVHPLIAGNRAADWAALVPESKAQALTVLPDAGAVLLIPADSYAKALTPIYGRGPDATPIKDRAPA